MAESDCQLPVSMVPNESTTGEYVRMTSGPKVDIYVGAERKHYSLPKLLLCHCSPYFDHCFNGRSKEADEQKLELPEDTIADFEIIIDFILCGSISYPYADKYAMGEKFCEILYENLKRLMEAPGKEQYDAIAPDQIELIFRLTRDGDPLRTLIAAEVLSTYGLKGGERAAEFRLKEKQIPDFAFEMLQQIRRSLPDGTAYADPYTGQTKTFFY